jgi:hypothetical protein
MSCLIRATITSSNITAQYREELILAEGTSSTNGYEELWRGMMEVWNQFGGQTPISIVRTDQSNQNIVYRVNNPELLEQIINFDARLNRNEAEVTTEQISFQMKHSWEFWSMAKKSGQQLVHKSERSNDYFCMNHLEAIRCVFQENTLESLSIKNRTSPRVLKTRLCYIEKYLHGNAYRQHNHTIEASIPEKFVNNWVLLRNGNLDSIIMPTSEPAIKSTIYVLSHNRADRAKLEYGNLGNNTLVDYRQIIVVQPNDFNSYVATWGRTHIILKLPEKSALGVTVQAGGCGYARNQIQHIAKQLEPRSETMFMLDDNV